MRTYMSRMQRHATAPSDLVNVNKALCQGDISTEQALDLVAEHEDSWLGISGPFDELHFEKRMGIKVPGSRIVSITQPLPGNPNNKPEPIVASIPDEVTGWLYDLQVVEADSRLGTTAAERMAGRSVLAVELHHAPTSGLIAYVALSMPRWDGSVDHTRTTFQAVPFNGELAS